MHQISLGFAILLYISACSEGSKLSRRYAYHNEHYFPSLQRVQTH